MKKRRKGHKLDRLIRLAQPGSGRFVPLTRSEIRAAGRWMPATPIERLLERRVRLGDTGYFTVEGGHA